MGLTSNLFELVNTFYVAFDEDSDDVTPVIRRSLALLAGRGLAVPAIEAREEAESLAPDVLADIGARA